jgi:hypothetical protein
VPRYGTLKTLRLEAPSPALVERIVAARLRPALEELPDFTRLAPIFPFTAEQVSRVAATEPTLRDMLQQFRRLFDHVVYGGTPTELSDPVDSPALLRPMPVGDKPDALPIGIKSVTVVHTPAVNPKAAFMPTEFEPQHTPEPADHATPDRTPADSSAAERDPPSQECGQVTACTPADNWAQEMRTARRQLDPEGSLTGATRELQAGLGKLLEVCHEHGVKVGPWRLHHVVSAFNFGDHPTYGALTIAHWGCKDGQPW